MKKILFWIVLVLSLFFTIGTMVTIFSHTAQIANKITLGAIPYIIVGILLDFITNPAGLLGIILLVFSYILKKKFSKKTS